MHSPCEPVFDKDTGRVLTEWFEHIGPPDDETIRQQALENFGVDEFPRGLPGEPMTHEKRQLAARIASFISSRKNRAFRSGMTRAEVQVRLDEASKMVQHQKFLPQEVQERTGLELNPLWMMETLVRSGVLSAKEQVAALKELASYTHSKAPTVNHSTTTTMSPDDWALELAKENYSVIDEPEKALRAERGSTAEYHQKKNAIDRKSAQLRKYNESALAEIEQADFEDIDDPTGS